MPLGTVYMANSKESKDNQKRQYPAKLEVFR